jgi:hypothetical protein
VFVCYVGDFDIIPIDGWYQPGKTGGKRVLPPGEKRIVHVHAKGLQKNLSDGTRDNMVIVRPFGDPRVVLFCREVKIRGSIWIGPSFEAPLPGTDGRGVCYVVTEGEIEVSF